MDLLERLQHALADRYRIERELGRGGMATVYLAEDLKHARRVALKVLRPEIAPALGADRFQREIAIAARLQHPYVLGLFDSGVTEGVLWWWRTWILVSTRSVPTRGIPISSVVSVSRPRSAPAIHSLAPKGALLGFASSGHRVTRR